MTPNNARRGFYIGIKCPACGGELELENDFFVTRCEHCDSVLRILFPETTPAYLVQPKIASRDVRFHVDRHLKENNLPLTDFGCAVQAIFCPYWKIDAIVLKLRHRSETRQLHNEVTDTDSAVVQRSIETTLAPFTATTLATRISELLPYSLGARADVVRLLPFTEEHLVKGFEMLDVDIPATDAAGHVSKTIVGLGNISTTGDGVNLTELFRPLCGIVYFPYFILNYQVQNQSCSALVDAVTGRVIDLQSSAILDPERIKSKKTSRNYTEVGVVIHRCGNCGEPLPLAKSYLIYCANCQRLSMFEKHPALSADVLTTATPAGSDEDRFPFWRIKFGIAGEHLVVPAFAMPNFESLYRLSTRFSTAVSSVSFTQLDSLDQHCHPANVSITEALTLRQVISRRKQIGDDSRAANRPQANTDNTISEVTLFYASFRRDSYFFVDSSLGAVTFEKAQIG